MTAETRPDGRPGDRPVVLRVENLSKNFPGTRALDGVELDIREGEIHALVGGNGSGKSTLIKILAGVYQADPGGTITVGDHQYGADNFTPARAKAAGLHFVHQDPGVFLDLSVAENMAIGHGFETTGGAVRWAKVRARARDLIERFHIQAAPDTPVATLGPADRTLVAIARALQDQENTGEGLLVLDEPTTSLPASEVDLLFRALRGYAAAGQTILYVSHRLDEVLDIADRITVLRDGRLVATVPAEGMDQAQLIELILGRPLDRVFPDMPEASTEDLVLEVDDIHGPQLEGVSFGLKRGEVLGIAGLLGSGKEPLMKMLFGALSPTSGQIRIKGNEVRMRSPADALDHGIAYVPQDRAGEGAFADMTVRENLSAAQVGRYWTGLHLQHRRERSEARQVIIDFLIKAVSDAVPLSTLSGGNQQKVVVARWLRRRPTILLLHEPTQGVDIGARAEIYTLVRRAVEKGSSVIVVTADFEELAHVSDRVIVLANGRVAAEVVPPHIESQRLTELAYTAKVAS